MRPANSTTFRIAMEATADPSDRALSHRAPIAIVARATPLSAIAEYRRPRDIPCQFGVPDGMLDVAVAKIALQRAGVMALVGQGELADVTQHVRGTSVVVTLHSHRTGIKTIKAAVGACWAPQSEVRIIGIAYGWIGSTTAFAQRSEGVKAPFASLSFRM